MDVDKSIENGELTYSDGSLFRPFPFRMIVIIGIILYACYQTILEEFGMKEAIAVVLILGLVFWFSKNLFFNYADGNKLLTIPTELNVTVGKSNI